MKQLTCEMCGSTDLIKQDGVFVCQTCGTKYSIEEAKKMMVEGTVDVSGSTVKIDTSDELTNLYQLARRARDENNSDTAAKYYDMILQKAPDSWEAAFYYTYYKAANCTIAGISSAANSIANCISNVFALIENYDNENTRVSAYKEVSLRVFTIQELFFTAAKNTHASSRNMLTPDTDPNVAYYKNAVADFAERTGAIGSMLGKLASQLEILYISTYPDEKDLIDFAVKAWKNANQMVFEMYKQLDKRYQSYYFDNYKTLGSIFDSEIQKYDVSYNNPFNTEEKPSTGGCYVATAVYGSYDCPQVWTLRRYRDHTLAETWYGRAFIRFYYAVSPTLVKWFGECVWFKSFWRPRLDKMVESLNRNGVADTPYEDRTW